MNLETNLPDPSLKFATGILKGRTLDSSGKYRIVMRDGEQVAQFSNGSLAKFYRDAFVVTSVNSNIAMAHSAYKDMPLDIPERQWSEAAASVALDNDDESGTRRACNNPDCLQGYEHPGPCDTKLIVQQRATIAAFRLKNRRRPVGASEPVYCVYEDGRIIYTVSRAETGTGLREFMWLYEKFRELGRGRLAAFFEAHSIYFL